MNSSNSSKRHGAAEEQLLLHEIHRKNNISVVPSKQNSTGYSERKFAEPVHLTPAWEEKNLPNDVLNFKNVTMEQAELETNPPKDRFLFVYLIVLIHGMGTLMPWNMFITADKYFENHKLSASYTGIGSNYTVNGTTYTGKDTVKFYRDNFMLYLTFFSQVPNVVFAWLNIYINFGGSLTSRIVYSLVVEVIIFVFTEVLVLVDTSSVPVTFFWATMVSVFILNIASGIYQNTIYGLVAKLPAKYTGAVILGNNLSGIFSALIGILKDVMAPSEKTGAMYYFLVALLVLFVCFDTYFVLPLLKFYKYHDLQFTKASQKALTATQEANLKPKTPYMKIFRSCSMQCFNAFFIFFVTLSIFPSVHKKVKMIDKDFFVPEKHFVIVTCFLTFSVFATLGNLLANVVTFPGPNKLCIPVVLRVVFIPLFLFSNFSTEDKRVMPIYITDDWAYWAIAISFAFTSGYFSSLAMMYCGKTVAPEHSSVAGMFGAACLVTGIICGIAIGFCFPPFINNVSW